MISGYETANVSVHGNEGSSLIELHIRSRATLREKYEVRTKKSDESQCA